jgi:hypothetical protein
MKNAAIRAVFWVYPALDIGSLSRYERYCHGQKQCRNDAADYCFMNIWGRTTAGVQVLATHALGVVDRVLEHHDSLGRFIWSRGKIIDSALTNRKFMVGVLLSF